MPKCLFEVCLFKSGFHSRWTNLPQIRCAISRPIQSSTLSCLCLTCTEKKKKTWRYDNWHLKNSLERNSAVVSLSFRIFFSWLWPHCRFGSWHTIALSLFSFLNRCQGFVVYNIKLTKVGLAEIYKLVGRQSAVHKIHTILYINPKVCGQLIITLVCFLFKI